MDQRIEKYFRNGKEKLLKIERKELKNNSWLFLYHQILTTAPKFFDIGQKGNFKQEKIKLLKKSTKDIILDGQRTLTWAIFMTLNVKETF